MEKRKRNPIKDKTRNKNFAAAFIYLKGKDRKNFGTNILLAEKMGVDADTITNVVHCHTSVTENFIASFQEATGGMFNVHFLRGESDVMLAVDVAPDRTGSTTPPQPATPTTDALTAALLAAKDETIVAKEDAIASLKRELSGKDETIAAKDALISSKDTLIKTLQQQIEILRLQSAIEKGLSEDGTFLSELAKRTGVKPYVNK